MPRQTTRSLRDLLLDATIGDERVDAGIVHLAEAVVHELGRNGSTKRESMSLTERTGGVLYSAAEVALRMPRHCAAPLAKRLQVVKLIEACQRERAVEHRGHVTGVEEEAVAALPCGIERIITKVLRIEHVDEVSATHGSTRVTRFCFFYCCRRENTDIVGC